MSVAPYQSICNRIKAYNVSKVVCATCLSRHRKLYSMRNLPELLNVCSNLTLMSEDNICWECKALLTRMVKFRIQAVKSKTILTHMAQLNKMPEQKQTFSSLTVKVNTTVDAVFMETIKDELIESDPDKSVKDKIYIMPATPIKYEPDAVNDADLIMKDEPERIMMNMNYDDEDQIEDNDLMEQLTIPQLLEHKVSEDILNERSGIKLRTLDDAQMILFRDKQRTLRWYKHSNYKCKDCIMFFSSHEMLIQHLELHKESSGPYKCDVCGIRFSDSNSLQRHIQVHYKYYECNDCKWTHPFLQNILKHRLRLHDNRIRKCNQCDAEFQVCWELSYHIQTVHKEKPSCEQCGKKFKSGSTLKRHMKLHEDVPRVECNICHKKYRGPWGLTAHMRTHDKTINKDAYCAECNKHFKNIYMYRTHLKQSKSHVSEEEARYECAYCGRKCTTKTSLQVHIELKHLKLANHVCDVCNMAYNSNFTLRRHKREKHSGRVRKRSNMCHICGKGFMKKRTLEDHINSHLGVRPYRCELCNANFAYSAALYNHNRLVHLKEKRPQTNTNR